MEHDLYGFLIGEEVTLHIAKRKLFRISNDPSINSVSISMVPLSETSVRLLTRLLKNGEGVAVSKNEILSSVWEELGFSSSNQRLWHAINELRKRLSAIGFPDDFIVSIRDGGYSTGHQYKITSLILG